MKCREMIQTCKDVLIKIVDFFVQFSYNNYIIW